MSRFITYFILSAIAGAVFGLQPKSPAELDTTVFVAPNVVSRGLPHDYKSVYQTYQEEREATIDQAEDWLRKYELTIMIMLALFIPLGGWMLSSVLKAMENSRRMGREQFLAQATATITDSVSERLVSKLEVLEERIEWIYKNMTEYERKAHTLDNEINKIQLELTNVATEVKLLRATRREFLNRLNDQLQAAEQHLADVINKCRAANECDYYIPQIEKIVDPFDTNGDGTLY
jgi:predicted RNase H-like nuclease (RuvC/YqgF family)